MLGDKVLCNLVASHENGVLFLTALRAGCVILWQISVGLLHAAAFSWWVGQDAGVSG